MPLEHKATCFMCVYLELHVYLNIYFISSTGRVHERHRCLLYACTPVCVGRSLIESDGIKGYI